VTIFLRKAKPLLLWIYFNVLASIFPFVVSLGEDFSDSFDILERVLFCILITFPSVYAILVIFSYYRELSQSRGQVLRDPRLEGATEFWWANPSAPMSCEAERPVDVYVTSHRYCQPSSSPPSKFDFV
jgi:hypothetical protein